MVLSIEQVNKSFGANVVLQDITAKIEDNDRIGLIGVNGAGKSTLLNLIVGDLHPDTGVISIANGATIGFLRQNSGLSSENTIWEEMRSVFQPILEMEQRLRRLEQEMAGLNIDHEGNTYRALAEEYAVLDERFSKAEGYLVDVKIVPFSTEWVFPINRWKRLSIPFPEGKRPVWLWPSFYWNSRHCCFG